MEGQGKCIIWGTSASIKDDIRDDHKHIFDSPRAGGKYIVEHQLHLGACRDGLNLSDEEKIQLSGWIAKKNLKGNSPPFLDVILEDENWPKKLPPIPSPEERAYLLLEGLVEKAVIGRPFSYDFIRRKSHDNFFYALSYSNKEEEMVYFLNHLKESGWIKYDGNFRFQVTVEGFKKIKESSKSDNSKTAFIAMWIDPSMKNLKQSIEKAVKNTGYDPLRIDDKKHINKIDDEILSEIEKARFVVCDLTSAATDKPRSSVYFEAGYAKGKKIPVIWTCKKQMKEVHFNSFDTRQYKCLFWDENNMADFIKELQTHIEDDKYIGKGPLKEV